MRPHGENFSKGEKENTKDQIEIMVYTFFIVDEIYGKNKTAF